MPGLLHLAFRRTPAGVDSRSIDAVEDVLFTDPPGEWFGVWAIDRNAPAAEGARWIAAQSDAFVLLVDSEALAGPERGTAREQILRLSQRLSESAQRTRVAVVWTKADIPVRDGIRAAVIEALEKHLPGYRSFSVQVPLLTSPQMPNIDAGTVKTFIDLLIWLLDAPRSLSRSAFPRDLVLEVQRATANLRDPFLAYSSP